MKALLLGTLMGLIFAVGANAVCPNITGKYWVGDDIYVRYVQTACTTLSRYEGAMESHGTLSDIFDRRFANGAPVCSGAGECETVRFTNKAVVFEMNFNAMVMTDGHGQCSDRNYSLSKDVSGNLVALFSVYDCVDGFNGDVKKIFHIVAQ